MSRPAILEGVQAPPAPAALVVCGQGRTARSLQVALGAGGLARTPAQAPDPRDLVVVVEDAALGPAQPGSAGEDAGGQPGPATASSANRWLYDHRRAGLFVRAGWDAIWIGPLLQPGRPGCYQCLQARTRVAHAGAPAAERELWDRFATGRLTPPTPALTGALLAIVAELVRDEYERARTGRQPRLDRAVLWLPWQAGTVERHRFLPEPRCPVCGRVPDDAPERAVVTIAPRPRRYPGRFRAAPPPRAEDLVDRFVSPRTGLIHSVHVDYSGTTVNSKAVIYPHAPPGHPTRDWPADGSGRERDRTASVSVAVLEALERYGGMTADLNRRTVVTASYRELPGAEALDPRTLGLPPPELVPTEEGYTVYQPDLPLRWVWAWSFGRDRPILVPESVGFYYRHRKPLIAYECSSGCALGSCLEEAILYGLFEVIERDAFLLTWYARLPVPRIDWRTVAEPVTRLLAGRLEATTGDRLHLLNTTMPEGVPSVAAMVVDEADRLGYAKAFFGGGAHLEPERAILSAVHEVAMSDGHSPLSETETEQARAMLADVDRVRQLEHHHRPYFLPEAWPRLAFLSAGKVSSVDEAFPPARRYRPGPDLADDLRHMVDRYLRHGLDVIVVDHTLPEHRAAGLACAKVIVPGTLPMTFGHRHRRAAGIERLHTIPVRLGYRREPLPVDEINPYPHPFP